MPHIRWSAPAAEDLLRLYHFLAESSQEAAFRAQQRIRGEVKLLATHPGIGRPIEGMLPTFKELIVSFGHYAYVVSYRHDGEAIVILAVRHGREAGY